MANKPRDVIVPIVFDEETTSDAVNPAWTSQSPQFRLAEGGFKRYDKAVRRGPVHGRQAPADSHATRTADERLGARFLTRSPEKTGDWRATERQITGNVAERAYGPRPAITLDTGFAVLPAAQLAVYADRSRLDSCRKKRPRG